MDEEQKTLDTLLAISDRVTKLEATTNEMRRDVGKLENVIYGNGKEGLRLCFTRMSAGMDVLEKNVTCMHKDMEELVEAYHQSKAALNLLRGLVGIFGAGNLVLVVRFALTLLSGGGN